VVSGTKVFTLLPPAEAYRMHLREYRVATFAPRERQANAEGCRAEDAHETPVRSMELRPVLRQPEQRVQWCPVDPNLRGRERNTFPLFFDERLPEPFQVEVAAGELLYLPAMWWHHVQQENDEEGLVIAVNFWYNMAFNHSYAHFKLLEHLAGLDWDRTQQA
jgi:peptidyl-lysine (3S)-dioxygenase / protease